MSSPYVGEIRMFAGNFAPVGWALCQGQLLSISDNDVLFNLIGTTYGGDGQNTFALPNLSSRVPVHQGSGFTLAQAGGSETVTLTAQQLPSHTHPVYASSSQANQASPSQNLWAQSALNQYSNQATAGNMAMAALMQSGGSQPHDNMLPFLCINFIIALFGIYPSQQ